MDKDLKWIKKNYGEKMMHLARSLFPQILETEGLLPQILKDHFDKNTALANDIESQNKIDEFKDYIFSFVKNDNEEIIKSLKSAKELMKQAGYVIFEECLTDEDIQKFKHYYRAHEELCTFKNERLKSCRVFFAVKEDAEKIKPQFFPEREDEYGTSVISIQFTRGKASSLSIKNRYNHTVFNPDNTFHNNLDNIIPGLTDAFYRDYGLKNSLGVGDGLILANYVLAKDGKYYRYNYQINDIYYCDNNIIIDNFEVRKLRPDRILADYFVFDFQNKSIWLYDKLIQDSFVDTSISDMIFKDNTIIITRRNGKNAIIKLDKYHHIISITDEQVKSCGNKYCSRLKYLEEINLSNLGKCGEMFCGFASNLTNVALPKLKRSGKLFCCKAKNLTKVDLPSLKICGDGFCMNTKNLKEVNLPNLEVCGNSFCVESEKSANFYFPKLRRHGKRFCDSEAELNDFQENDVEK